MPTIFEQIERAGRDELREIMDDYESSADKNENYSDVSDAFRDRWEQLDCNDDIEATEESLRGKI